MLVTAAVSGRSEASRRAETAAVLHAAGLLEVNDDDPWSTLAGWRLWNESVQSLMLDFGDRIVAVPMTLGANGECRFDDDRGVRVARLVRRNGLELVIDLRDRVESLQLSAVGDRLYVHHDGFVHVIGHVRCVGRDVDAAGVPPDIRAPVPGRVVKVVVSRDNSIERGETLLVLEAMKMEFTIDAPRDGVVAEVHVSEGDRVEEGERLVSVTSDAKEDAPAHST